MAVMIELNKIIHADCMDTMKDIPDKWFELAIVDPDFGLNDKISCGGTWASKYKKEDGFLGGKPDSFYFEELFRISENQIIWGGNYFIENLFPSRCFLIWDKKAKMKTLADCEMAWTSFDKNAKMFSHSRNVKESRIHICQKPVALYRWLLQNYAKPGDKIIDTHSGSGSCAIACFLEHHDFLAIEKDEDYYRASVTRYNEVISQGRLF